MKLEEIQLINELEKIEGELHLHSQMVYSKDRIEEIEYTQDKVKFMISFLKQIKEENHFEPSAI